MLQLLMHHVGRTDLTGIANCHVRGLHSIMLHDQDGNRVRIYCTTDGVDTHYNFIPVDEYIANEYDYSATDIQRIEMARQSSCSNMTLGLHGHSTDVRLEVLAGSMYNITAAIERNAEGGMRRYIHSSHITGEGTTRLASGERWRPTNITQTRMRQGDNVYLEARTLHTVYVDGFCSWMVYERGPVINHDSHFFSYNTSAHRSDMTDMYRPMTSPECQALLARVIAAYQSNAAQTERSSASARRVQENKDRLAACKAAVEAARTTNPSVLRRLGRSSDLRLMAAATGHLRPASTIRLLSDAEWARWLHRIERLADEDGLSDTSFFEWAAQVLEGRQRPVTAGALAGVAPDLVVTDDPVQTSPTVTNAAAQIASYAQQLESMRVPITPHRTGRTTPTSGLLGEAARASMDRIFRMQADSTDIFRPELP